MKNTMDKYRVTLNQRAFRDIESIYEYIALEKLSPENAKGQTDRIWKALKALDTFPQSHQKRNEGAYAGKDYRQLIIDNYIAIFRIDESTKTVHIITVQYQGRNL
jgi:plasmid stabilization system protein ParE